MIRHGQQPAGVCHVAELPCLLELTEGFDSQAAVGLFVAGDSEVANGVSHGIGAIECTPRAR